MSATEPPRRVPRLAILVGTGILGAAVGAVTLLARSAPPSEILAGAVAGAIVGPLIGAAYIVVQALFLNTPKT
jgi:hypothetical protein